MNLADFIQYNMETILAAWEQTAGQLQPSNVMGKAELRDHAKEMLQTIAQELQQPTTDQPHKNCSSSRGESKTAAEEHGMGRQGSGFSVMQMAAEFRALRASVIRLWGEVGRSHDESDFADLIRFNEAIDRALAESVASYFQEKEHQGRLYETMLSSMQDLGFVLSLEGKVLYANKSVTSLYNTRLTTLVGKSFMEMGFSSAGNLQEGLQQAASSKESFKHEVAVASDSGEYLQFECIYVPVIDDQGKVEAVAGTARDITERKASEKAVWRHANYDPLTGIPNRRLFLDRLGQEIKHAQRSNTQLALLFIDLDRFKEVNDLHGHNAGDLLLKQAAERICRCIRDADTVARLGGDEFAAILVNTKDVAQIERIAESMLEALVQPIPLEAATAHISASLGIALFPEDATSAENLLTNADQAMYLAKSAGRNQVCFFTKAMQQTAVARLQRINELRFALQGQQLHLYYQPIVDLDSGRVVKAEALLRWMHPQQGCLLPRHFIGLAEEHGLIEDISDWVFQEAAQRAKQWSQKASPPLQITINNSPVQFMHPKKEGTSWRGFLDRHGLAGRQIAVELTESTLLQDSPHVSERLADIQAAGIQLALDDFGTGYASMTYLERFPIDFIKIDQSFVQGRRAESSCQVIVEMIILMAHKLGLKVIAEGVETEAQRDWLKAAGCDYAQGFLFSKPLPADDFEKLLDEEFA